jgi:hypothetical protein
MEILRSFSLNGAALPGQENLTGSLLDIAGLDTDLTGALNKIKATVGKGVYKSGIEKLLAFATEGVVPTEGSDSSLQRNQTQDALGVTSEGPDIPNLFRQAVVPRFVTVNGSETKTANVDSLTGMTEGAQLVSAAATGELKVLTPLSSRYIAPGRLIFSTVNEEYRAPKTLVLQNTGTGPLSITDLSIGNSVENIAKRSADNLRDEDFKLNAPAGSFTIPAGGSRKISIEFKPLREAKISTDSITDTLNGESYASLNISMGQSTKRVNLAGLNFADYEGNSEPSLAEISRIYGWKINIGSEKQLLGGSKTPLGSEVSSPYWQRADASKPVYLWPLAVASGRRDTPHGRVSYEPKGGSSTFLYELAGRRNDDNLPGSNSLSGGENQKLLPKIFIDNVNKVPGIGDVDITTTKAFALNSNGSWTIDSRNGTGDLHNWRIYPVQNAQGNLIPNTWFAGVDPGNTEGGFKNYDYQDGVYLLKNVKPAEPLPPQQLPIRLDAGSSSSYTDTRGKTWFPDAGFVTPSAAEAGNRGPAQIANTNDDELYWTYRSKVPNLTYNIPVNQPGKVDIFLRFAEMYWGAPGGGPGGLGKRVVDVLVENKVLLDDFDIYADAGGALKAIEKSFKNIQVSDGTLNIQFKAEVDYPLIAGISVLPV